MEVAPFSLCSLNKKPPNFRSAVSVPRTRLEPTGAEWGVGHKMTTTKLLGADEGQAECSHSEGNSFGARNRTAICHLAQRLRGERRKPAKIAGNSHGPASKQKNRQAFA